MVRRKGSILILVLFVMVVLSLTAVSFAYRAGIESRMSNQRAILAILRAQAQSALDIALARLAAETNEFDHRAEPWCAHGPLAEERWLPEWSPDQTGRPSAFVTEYQVIDEEGKLNVMYASSEDLEKLGMRAEQAAALQDWLDADSVPQAQGAEDDYYLRQPTPHRCKNAPLDVLEELLLIRGFGPADYQGEDADHDAALDEAEDDGGRTAPPDDRDGQLRLGWVDLLTCLGDGRINLNTAPEAVLRTLPLSDEAVGQVLGYRAFDEHSSGNLEDHAFRNETDIDQLQGLTPVDRDVLRTLGTFRSTHFRVFIQARHVTSRLTHRLEALVRMNGRTPKVLQLRTQS